MSLVQSPPLETKRFFRGPLVEPGTTLPISKGTLTPEWKAACLTLIPSSLVPRPFPPPVFDRILYAKTEGEGLGERVTCVTSGRREGRHRGGGA